MSVPCGASDMYFMYDMTSVYAKSNKCSLCINVIDEGFVSLLFGEQNTM